jgi:hypothetical protein
MAWAGAGGAGLARDHARRSGAVLARFRGGRPDQALAWHSPASLLRRRADRHDGGHAALKRHHAGLRTAAGLAEEHRFMAHLRCGRAVPEIWRTGQEDAVTLGD